MLEVNCKRSNKQQYIITFQQLLNNCFDDIEKFVSRLQQAAEAYKELERRRGERGGGRKNKKVYQGGKCVILLHSLMSGMPVLGCKTRLEAKREK